MTKELISPRPYQWETIEAAWYATDGNPWESGTRLKRPAVVLPTGAGKTVIFSWLANMWTEAVQNGQRSGRVLILVHRQELAEQTIEKLAMIAPNLPTGIIQADRDEHEGRAVMVGSVQTLRKPSRLRALRESGAIGLVIVDECHHATAASYRMIMTDLGCYDAPGSGAYALGFTATMGRGDGGRLGDVWERVIYRRDILDMINGYVDGKGNQVPGGYLVNVSGKMVTVDGFSLADVAMSGGDYQIGSLSEALMSADAPEFVARAYMEHAADLPGIVFTPTVETAHAFADALKDRGLSAEPVWGAMPTESRKDVLTSFKAGRTQILVNCMVLTEGFDAPRAQVAVIARPTAHASLYVQMVGRVLRPSPGKTSALVLDIVGASQEHRLASLVDLTSERIKEIREGESLIDAVRREKEERNPALRNYAVTYEDVDLFRETRVHWLQTYEGIWFTATSDQIFFIWPTRDPDLYRVGVRPMEEKGGDWLHDPAPLDIAKAWAETEALAADFSSSYGMGSLIRRDASWRKRREPPTEGQLRKARQLKLSVPAGILKRELSDLITVEKVSRILDYPLTKGRKR